MIIYLIGIIVLLVLNGYCAHLMKNAAISKGYGEDLHAWAVCFWLGIFGYLYIIALPDKVAQSQNQQIIELLQNKREEN